MAGQYPEQLSNPTIESSLKQWREHGGLHRLEGTKCEDCGELYYPRRFVCPKCHSLRVIPYRYKGKGTLVNFVADDIPAAAQMGFREHSSRIMCLVRLDEGPVILGELIEISDSKVVQSGIRVKTVIRKQARSANTDWRYAYKFVIDKE